MVTLNSKTPEEIIMETFILLMTHEVIPGCKPLTLNEIYELDISYYMKLIKYSKKEKSEEAIFIDEVGL